VSANDVTGGTAQRREPQAWGNPSSGAPAAATIELGLVSHTNVGKTTLARTLLRRDIGEVRDRAHVTEIAEGHVLVDSPQGDALRLWDTPGFGDSARLLKRLRLADNPIGWLLTQVWDRFTDRPFYSSQQALRNVREQSDVILYLVNAAEEPAAAGYVDAEMQILGWIGKPVLLLLNQMGAPRGHESDRVDEMRWREHLAGYPWLRGALSLDAFARCWVQEDALLRAVGAVLPADRQQPFARLRAAWRARNLDTFDASMRALAIQLAAAAADRESVDERALGEQARRWLGSIVGTGPSPDADVERAMNALAARLDVALRAATDELIRLHGLSGRAAAEVLARVAGQFDVARRANVGKTGALAGLVSGALGGLAADLAAGGITFGAGALIGGILGALGAGGAAQAYNLARGARDGKVAWSPAFLTQRFSVALLRYLAVAHFGRGRGDWVEGECPQHWRGEAEAAAARRQVALDALWLRAEEGDDRHAIERALEALVADAAREVLTRLYPDAADIFSAAGERRPPAPGAHAVRSA
jgi:hypothetical protein